MISIITTVRNGEKYILETLNNIKDQTFSNYEYIIVDDGSTDGTIGVINDFLIKNENLSIKLIQSKTVGRGKALNLAVKNANYEWISIIDADDLWHNQKLEIQYEIINNHPEIDLLATKSSIFSDSKDITLSGKVDKKFSIINKNSLLYTNSISHSSVLIRKELASYDDTRKSQFDYELWLRISFEQNATIAILSSTMNFHRVHVEQSFEGKGGRLYRLRAFKIKSFYCFKYFKMLPLLYGTFKFLGAIILPRKVKLTISKKNERKNL